MKTALQKLAEAVYRPVAEMSSMDLALRLSLLLFVISSWIVGYDWQWRYPLRALALTGLIIPGLYKNRGLWLLIAFTMFTKSIYNWWTQDNHIFLLTWWSLGVAIALHTAAPERAMATCGRLLVGLSFFFAVVWKVLLSPDFIDGSYFQFAFFTDRRFFPMTASWASLRIVRSISSRSAASPPPTSPPGRNGTTTSMPVSRSWRRPCSRRPARWRWCLATLPRCRLPFVPS